MVVREFEREWEGAQTLPFSRSGSPSELFWPSKDSPVVVHNSDWAENLCHSTVDKATTNKFLNVVFVFVFSPGLEDLFLESFPNGR